LGAEQGKNTLKQHVEVRLLWAVEEEQHGFELPLAQSVG